jgi:hypothetical protein
VVAEEEVDVGAIGKEDGCVGGGVGGGNGLHLGDGLGIAVDGVGIVLPAHPSLYSRAAASLIAAMPARSACSLSVLGSAPGSISSAMAVELFAGASAAAAASLFASPLAASPPLLWFLEIPLQV